MFHIPIIRQDVLYNLWILLGSLNIINSRALLHIISFATSAQHTAQTITDFGRYVRAPKNNIYVFLMVVTLPKSYMFHAVGGAARPPSFRVTVFLCWWWYSFMDDHVYRLCSMCIEKTIKTSLSISDQRQNKLQVIALVYTYLVCANFAWSIFRSQPYL